MPIDPKEFPRGFPPPISIRPAPELLDRIDALVDRAKQEPGMRANRSSIIFAALEIGVAVLEKKHAKRGSRKS